MESLEWLKNLERLCLILLFGFCLLTFSASSVMAVDKSNSTTSTSSSSTSSPSSSHPHSSSHNKDTYNQGSAAGKNDGKVGVYDLAAACTSGSSACAAGYKHSYVETCTKSTFGCGDGPTTLGSTTTSKSLHNHNTATKTSSTSSSSSTSPHTKQNVTNLVIQVVTDNQTSWDGGYCCTPGTFNTKLIGNLSNPLTGRQQFSMGCSADFLAMARIDSSAHNPPHLTINVLDNDKVIGSNTTNTINDNATVNGKC
jgi:hypothetical protein